MKDNDSEDDYAFIGMSSWSWAMGLMNEAVASGTKTKAALSPAQAERHTPHPNDSRSSPPPTHNRQYHHHHNQQSLPDSA